MTYAKFRKAIFERAEVKLELTPEQALERFKNLQGIIVAQVLESRGWIGVIDHGKRTLIVRAKGGAA